MVQHLFEIRIVNFALAFLVYGLDRILNHFFCSDCGHLIPVEKFYQLLVFNLSISVFVEHVKSSFYVSLIQVEILVQSCSDELSVVNMTFPFSVSKFYIFYHFVAVFQIHLLEAFFYLRKVDVSTVTLVKGKKEVLHIFDVFWTSLTSDGCHSSFMELVGALSVAHLLERFQLFDL